MIKVLVVEDSPVVREFLVHILNSDPKIQVIGTAKDGEEALKVVEEKKPDIITMDINMPRMDGFETTRRIMELHPTPIVIVSGNWDTKEVATTFRAIEAGALTGVRRPAGIGHPEHGATVKELLDTVKLMSEVKVIRRWSRLRRQGPGPSIVPSAESELNPIPSKIRLVVMGASTGGPVVLQKILSELPKNFLSPLLIVQHMATGFIQGFVEWVSQTSGFPVRVAIHGELPLPGHAYVAPDGLHMGIGSSNRIALSHDEPENGLRPSVSYLFRSVMKTYGRNAIGVLLTGMGKDGAEELKLMKDSGSVTIVQDKESSVVHGMPGEAIGLGGATYVLPAARIAAALTNLVDRMEKETIS
ncbi:MAG: chemotaxis response regulator protein-glutamate methylesterase [Deltaproteobacteria bacterium RBG_16_48_10]|nr:MAG: chemotaxis response regulator protein-glutamate methylesterase [Deltaproteobacteria bacterium RBG_16_48_10]